MNGTATERRSWRGSTPGKPTENYLGLFSRSDLNPTPGITATSSLSYFTTVLEVSAKFRDILQKSRKTGCIIKCKLFLTKRQPMLVQYKQVSKHRRSITYACTPSCILHISHRHQKEDHCERGYDPRDPLQRPFEPQSQAKDSTLI